MDAIAQNVRTINKILDGKSKLMAIVKADAYGHGATFVARELEASGVDFFGVSCVDEALQLRESGINKNILILGYTNPIAENIKKLIKYNITQTIFDFDDAKIISDIARDIKGMIKVHLKIDTGMNRIGFRYTGKNKDADIISKIKNITLLDNLDCEGIFTHFASSDEIYNNFTNEQSELFRELITSLEKENIYFKLKHAANSGATINCKETHFDYVRCGLILYGLYPSKQTRIAAENNNIKFMPAMQLKTVISQIHTVNKSETVSYNRTYRAGKDIICAALPIGYADGFSRLLSNSASVILKGRQVPVIGRVCMDQSMIDITNCPEAKVGDVVTIFGCDEESGDSINPINSINYIGVEQIADMMETINYEVVCLIGKRVPRIFYKNGVETGQLNYISPK